MRFSIAACYGRVALDGMDTTTTQHFDAYLGECRALTLQELRGMLPRDSRCQDSLYDIVLDYPQRQAKALRPALCIAACRGLGGALDAVLPTAAVLELYHNAFLIHDDIEDGSELRRERPTLHRLHGSPIAVNVGDAMLALALQPLLDNMRFLGMGKSLRILELIARMARESAEGQAIELYWIRQGVWDVSEADYLRMVYKKTSWYSFMAPMLAGAVIAGAAPATLAPLRKFAALLGMAFQIRDDVLNLTTEGGAYGKETAGDLWEGKRTLILIHALRHASATERQAAADVLRKARPESSPQPHPLGPTLDHLRQTGAISADVYRKIDDAVRSTQGSETFAAKTEADIAFLRSLIERAGSLQYASLLAARHARRAQQFLESSRAFGPSAHYDFLRALVGFVIGREH